MNVEYRVRPVTRYIVTRFYENVTGGGCEVKGEFDSPDVAYQVGYALAKEEHQRLGYPVGDERIKYPDMPVSGTAINSAVGSLPVCKGKNCGSTDGRNHSMECQQEYEAACNGVLAPDVGTAEQRHKPVAW